MKPKRVPYVAAVNPAVLALLTVSLFCTSALALECPIPAGGTLVLRAPLGDLVIDTSGTDRVEIEVGEAIAVEEACFADHVDIEGTAPERVYEPVIWQIRVPRAINLDLLTYAGTIRIATIDGNVTARNTGGSIVAGDIAGNAAMSTQGGSISVGNVAGDAEFRSLGGRIDIGDVGGNAELETEGGPITVGTVSGEVRAETAGGNINVTESRGDLVAITLGGDIRIGIAAARVTAETAGGNIACGEARGPFTASTDLGNIQITTARSWIEATTGVSGDIDANLVPTSLAGDLHVNLTANSGNIHLGLLANLPADVEAVVDQAVLRRPNVRSDFPLEPVTARPNLPPSFDQQFTTSPWTERAKLNGGGNPIRVRTSRGSIEISRIQR